MSKEINLVPFGKRRSSHEKKIVILSWVIAVFSILIVLASSILLFVVNTSSSLIAIKNEESVLSGNFSSMSDKVVKYIFISDRLKSTSDILAKRPNLLDTIDIIQKQTPKNVNIRSLIINKNNISISISSNSLAAIDWMLNNWLNLAEEKKAYRKISFDGIGVNDNSFEFTTSIRINIL